MRSQLSSEEQHRRETLYGLEGVRLDAYDEMVKPDRVFPVRLYTLRRWAPKLGATGFWLLVTLQQECFRNRRGATWCTISRSKLAAAAAVSENTVHRYLQESEHTDTGLDHWIQIVHRHEYQWSNSAGRMVQPTNRYHVVMDAPLAPVDQRGIAQIVQERGGGPNTPATALEPVLKELAELSLQDLMDLCEDAANRFATPVNWDETATYPTVADVVTTLGMERPDDDGATLSLRETCSQLQQAFVGRAFLGTQYFRREWMPILGPKLALAVVQLRSRCFWSEDEVRDEVELPFTVLAREAGCSARWLRTINETKPLTKAFFTASDRGRGRAPVFQISLLEPIAPQDKDRHEALLRSDTIVPGTGQLGLLSAAPENGMDRRQRTEPVDVTGPETGMGRRQRTEPVDVTGLENGMDRRQRTEPIDVTGPDNGMDRRQRTEPIDARERNPSK
jgi:hypothetical protein